MRLDGEQIIVETPMEGIVAADAAVAGYGDGLAEIYRNLDESQLPITMGKWATTDVLNGLKRVVDSGLTLYGYLDPAVAQGYLAQLGLAEGQPEAEPQVLSDEFPESVFGYLDFLHMELIETAGASLFQIHHAAPQDLTQEQLEVMASALREAGWNADVAPIEDGEETLWGVRIRSGQNPT